MKKLIFIFLLFAGPLMAQEQVFPGTGKTLGPIDVTEISGADTTLYFSLQGPSMPYSIQAIVTDAIETGAVGVYFSGSNDGSNYTVLADSLSMAVTTYPQSKYFTGESFPFAYGGLKINKNGATAGELKFIVLFR